MRLIGHEAPGDLYNIGRRITEANPMCSLQWSRRVGLFAVMIRGGYHGFETTRPLFWVCKGDGGYRLPDGRDVTELRRKLRDDFYGIREEWRKAAYAATHTHETADARSEEAIYEAALFADWMQKPKVVNAGIPE